MAKSRNNPKTDVVVPAARVVPEPRTADKNICATPKCTVCQHYSASEISVFKRFSVFIISVCRCQPFQHIAFEITGSIDCRTEREAPDGRRLINVCLIIVRVFRRWRSLTPRKRALVGVPRRPFVFQRRGQTYRSTEVRT